ncbi:hypothetical protein B0H13DRAFT_1865159 [Mycena leptocephala]|nr:hypothetical protein B0H13DRAFT_1865159 [Mycena leptocephala]
MAIFKPYVGHIQAAGHRTKAQKRTKEVNFARRKINRLREKTRSLLPCEATPNAILFQRAKHSSPVRVTSPSARKDIIVLVADAVPNGSAIPPQMLLSIERFTIRCSMDAIALTGGVSRLMHLNRNELVLLKIKGQLDDAYRDFLVQLAAQQKQLEVQQATTHRDVGKIFAITDALALNQSSVLFYSRLSVLFGPGLM